MIDTFAAMPIEVRKSQRKQYRAFLAERDGEVDFNRRTLARREARMRAYEQPLARLRTLDERTFAQQYERFDASRRSTPEMLLLLALVKVNAAEAFGVSKTFGRAMKRALMDNDDLESLLLIEETYHTRILLSSACLYGIDVKGAYTPPSPLRVLIGGIAHTPESLSRPLVLAGEILGTLLFANLLTGARKVLKDDPELADAIEERIIEVLVDELGHISFNRMCMGPVGLAQTRIILPLVAKSLASIAPEITRLGMMPHNPLVDLPKIADPARLPEVVRKQAFFA
jgi:hypothetical protein